MRWEGWDLGLHFLVWNRDYQIVPETCLTAYLLIDFLPMSVFLCVIIVYILSFYTLNMHLARKLATVVRK